MWFAGLASVALRVVGASALRARGLMLALVCGLILSGAPAPAQDMITVHRTILLPDGRPAAGARVTIRTYHAGRLIHNEATVTTADGQVRAEAPYVRPSAPFIRYGYLLIEAEGCAITVANLTAPPATTGGPLRRPDGAAPLPGPLRLQPAFTVRGEVRVRETGHPVAGADVSLHSLGVNPMTGQGIPLNIPGMGLATPASVTRTDAQGCFHLPGVVTEERGGVLSASNTAAVWASYREGGQLLYGHHTRFVIRNAAEAAGVILLDPTFPVSGRVVLGEQPVAGASVKLIGEPDLGVSLLPTATTGQDGHYHFPHVPAVSGLFTIVSHPELAGAWTRCFGNRTLPVQPTVVPDLALRPWTTLAVRVTDPQGLPPDMAVEVSAVYDPGYRDPDKTLGRGVATVKSLQDGLAQLRVPPGEATVSVYAPGYLTASLRITATPAPQEPVTLEVKRQQGFLLRFLTEQPERLVDCQFQFRTPDGQTTSPGSGSWLATGYLFYQHRQKPAARLDLRITHRREELLPWTPISSDAWPNLIRLPD